VYKGRIHGVKTKFSEFLRPSTEALHDALVQVRIRRCVIMMRLRAISFFVVSLLAVSFPLFAHHGGAAYETDKSVIVKGTVTAFVWSNPHVFVKVDVKDDKGNIVHWIVEAQNPVSMMQIGWSKDTFKPGDEVEIDAMPAKNGNPVGFLGSSSPTAPRRRIVINGKQFQP